MSLRNILMVVSLVLSVLIGLAIGRGRGPIAASRSGERIVKIGMSLDTQKEERWIQDERRFSARAKELGAEVVTQWANSDDSTQFNQAQQLIAGGVDVLVVVPHDGKAMARAVEMAHERGVPTIAYDRMIKDCDLDLYLSFDNVAVGRAQAQYVVDTLRGHGRIVRVLGSKTDNNAFLVKQGQDEVLKPYLDRGDMKIVHEDWADDWSPENAKKITNAARQNAGPEGFDAVIASSDGTAAGAIESLIATGQAGKVLVTGQDADLTACRRIAQGTQSMTVYKPLEKLARRAADAASDMARRRPIVAMQSVPNGRRDVPSILENVIVVTRDNLMDTVVKDNFHGPDTYEKIYEAVPADQRPPKK